MSTLDDFHCLTALNAAEKFLLSKGITDGATTMQTSLLIHWLAAFALAYWMTVGKADEDEQ